MIWRSHLKWRQLLAVQNPAMEDVSANMGRKAHHSEKEACKNHTIACIIGKQMKDFLYATPGQPSPSLNIKFVDGEETAHHPICMILGSKCLPKFRTRLQTRHRFNLDLYRIRLTFLISQTLPSFGHERIHDALEEQGSRRIFYNSRKVWTSIVW